MGRCAARHKPKCVRSRILRLCWMRSGTPAESASSRAGRRNRGRRRKSRSAQARTGQPGGRRRARSIQERPQGSLLQRTAGLTALSGGRACRKSDCATRASERGGGGRAGTAGQPDETRAARGSARTVQSSVVCGCISYEPFIARVQPLQEPRDGGSVCVREPSLRPALRHLQTGSR